jgi:hypothetical protein
MRVTTAHPLASYALVLLDGVEIKGCMWADTDTGEVCRLVPGRVHPAALCLTDAPATEVLRGTVQVLDCRTRLPLDPPERWQHVPEPRLGPKEVGGCASFACQVCGHDVHTGYGSTPYVPSEPPALTWRGVLCERCGTSYTVTIAEGQDLSPKDRNTAL